MTAFAAVTKLGSWQTWFLARHGPDAYPHLALIALRLCPHLNGNPMHLDGSEWLGFETISVSHTVNPFPHPLKAATNAGE
jgi:hypothetical protein